MCISARQSAHTAHKNQGLQVRLRAVSWIQMWGCVEEARGDAEECTLGSGHTEKPLCCWALISAVHLAVCLTECVCVCVWTCMLVWM